MYHFFNHACISPVPVPPLMVRACWIDRSIFGRAKSRAVVAREDRAEVRYRYADTCELDHFLQGPIVLKGNLKTKQKFLPSASPNCNEVLTCTQYAHGLYIGLEILLSCASCIWPYSNIYSIYNLTIIPFK